MSVAPAVCLRPVQHYVRISELAASADGLVTDFRANPKKYINVSVFRE